MTQVVRVLTLASASGRYGGPFDTARMQMAIAADIGLNGKIVAGHLEGDAVESADVLSASVRNVLPIGRFSGLWSRRVRSLLRSSIDEASVVHVSIARELIPLYASIYAIRKRRRLVVQPHGMLTGRSSFMHKVADIAIRSILRKSAVIALTDQEANELMRQYGALDTVVLGNPTLPPPEASPPKATDEVLFVGRLHPRKRVADFAAAASFAQSRGLRGNYVVVGPDEGDADLVIEAQRSTKNLTYEGAIPGDRVPERLSQCSVFVLPSRGEPWGNVLAASLAYGIPVVVTESAALAPMIKKYSAGLIVPDEAPEKIAVAVDEILRSPRLANSLSEGGLNLAAEHFSARRQRECLSGLYS